MTASVAIASESNDWLAVLRDAVKRSSLKDVGLRVGYSKATLSQVLNGKYPQQNLEAVADAVRANLMPTAVACPVIGELCIGKCQEHQQREFAATNPQRVRLYRACRAGCPHSKLRKTA